VIDHDASALAGAISRARSRRRAVATEIDALPRFRRHNVALSLVAQKMREHAHESLEVQVRIFTEVAAACVGVARASVWLYAHGRAPATAVDGAHAALVAFDTFDVRTGAHQAGLELDGEDFPDYFAALRADRTIVAEDARTDPATRGFSEAYLEPNGIGAILDAPLRVGERVLGVLCHEHVGGPRRWTEEDESIAAGIADFIALAFETHERERAEESLRASQIALERSRRVEAVGRLAGGVAHDFNNMLTVILSYAELLRRRLGDEHPLRPVADEIARAGHHAAELTRKLLSVSRRDRSQPKVIDLVAVVREMERFLHQLIGEDVELTLALPPEPIWIRADVGQIEQVLLNLAVNARDAMSTDGHLLIGVERSGAFARLDVRDTGRGMDESTRAHVFEPFFTTKEAGEGTGLGLFTVKGIVREAGGTIEVRSEPGEGTEVEILLPLRVVERAAAPRADAPPKIRGGAETILFVEDEDSVRDVVSEMLRELGYRVLIARSGEEALRIARQHQGVIDLLFSDVVMPSLSGPALADRILRLRPSVHVLFASGYAEDALKRYGERLAGAELLAKPFDREVLGAKIREVLSSDTRGGLHAPL
jgi:signal transduction histidine kinase/ActR/RegA family two-component response regulator